MRLLLIGGSGFIGRHVAAALRRQGHEVVAFHRQRTDPTDIVGDRHTLAASRAAFHAYSPDVVVDLILSSGGQAAEAMNVFRGMTGRIVALSSCDVYRACGIFHRTEGGPLQTLPLTETSDLRASRQTYPPAQMDRLKRIFGWLDEEYDKIGVEQRILTDENLSGTVLRLPMVYGPDDPLHRVGSLLERLAAGSPITFEEKHAAWRAPRGYVENVGDAIALAATSERAAGRVYNIAEPESLSEIEWARLVADAIGWDGRFQAVPRSEAPPELVSPANLDQHWIVDSTRIREELGYQERVPRSEAIARSVAWELKMADG